ncbi:acetyltransferase, GNAT family [Oesophagostomum dentatum]|uniref:N-terminal methionine N(alpha)-acetyltransferase NatE n=1 Tax=Oesophagostomum dentatum TaxID=61180 RepID=A0A0B1T431_OESDE|nr:acetyltransferase, GNAT family [Oesophagostomum dentatum]
MSLCSIDSSNIRPVKLLHAGVFPVQYSDAYFQKVQNNDLCTALMVEGECLGVVCSKFEIIGCTKTLYIMSLAVHPLYRCRGIGTRLLDFAVSKAESHQVSLVRLHVQVNNLNAIQFYQKRGFEIVETTKNYYNRCMPADAYVMQKRLQL